MTKVMLIEDDQSMVYLLETLLKMDGFLVVKHDVNGDITAAVMSQAPDVLLMDVHLGGKNGLDVLKKLRAEPRLGNLIVVMASGMYLKSEAMDAGANAFLLKPFMPDELVKTIRDNLPQQA